MKNFLFQHKKKLIFSGVAALLLSMILPMLLYFSSGGSKNPDAIEGIGFLYQLESMPFGTVISIPFIKAIDPFEKFICSINLAGERKIQTQEEYNAEVNKFEVRRNDDLKWIENLRNSESDVSSAEIEQMKIDKNELYNDLAASMNKPGEEYLQCEWLNYSYAEMAIIAFFAFVNIFTVLFILTFLVGKINNKKW